MPSIANDILLILVTLLLVVLNGFFVAAEFALVKMRPSRLTELTRQRRPFALTAQWLMRRLDRALSCCQLGITMASLGLGWIGEPAVASLLEKPLHAVGVTSEAVLHTIAFIVAFTIITAAHLVLGEQAPKIFAIRRPESMALWCAAPLKFFYVLSFPFLVALDSATGFLLRRVGVEGASGHDAPHSEEEIRALLSHAHAHGELSKSEARLLDAVFEFDETVVRQIMVPRVDVESVDIHDPFEGVLQRARTSRHTRYPLCEGSLDRLLGVLHVKDLIGATLQQPPDLRAIVRPPRYVPETMPVTRLLKHFQASHQHMAFVVDEYGMVIGLVTLENVIERIIGAVQDEFDAETPDITPDGPGRFIVQGKAPIEAVNRAMRLGLSGRGVDTISGLLTETIGRVVTVGDRIELDGAVAEVLEASSARATRVRLTVTPPAQLPLG